MTKLHAFMTGLLKEAQQPAPVVVDPDRVAPVYAGFHGITPPKKGRLAADPNAETVEETLTKAPPVRQAEPTANAGVFRAGLLGQLHPNSWLRTKSPNAVGARWLGRATSRW